MNKTFAALTVIQRRIENLFQALCLICGALLFLLLTGNVFTRIFPVISLHWFGEIVELLFAWLIFLGSAVLYSRREHFMIDWLSQKTAGTSFASPYRIFIALVGLVFSGTLFLEGFRLTVLAHDWTSVLRIPRKFFYLSMPVGGIFMVYASLLELVDGIRKKPDKAE